MNRILADPALEAQPNFESPAYEGWLDALVQGGMTREDALTRMADGWKDERQERITLWLQQTEDDARVQRELEERVNAEQEAEEENERRETEKKKPKINDFDAEAFVADVLVPRPSQFALQKIRNMEYVELWYFSPDGCRDASENTRSTAEDAFGLARVDDVVAFKPMSSFKASQKALQDHDLSWRQFDIAKTSFLVHIEKCGWPEKHQQALAMFFTILTNHENRMRPRGEKTLLRYAALVRREWHDRLTMNQGFNIGIFNASLYSTISETVWEEERDASIKMVRTSLSLASSSAKQTRFASLCYHAFGLDLHPVPSCSRYHIHADARCPFIARTMCQLKLAHNRFPSAIHASLMLATTHSQLQNSLAASQGPSRSRQQDNGRSGRGRYPSAETPPSPTSGRFHPYRAAAANQPGKSKGRQSFPSGAGQPGPSACALCLGRFRHNVHKCESEFLWDKRTKTRCRRNAEGHLVNPEGRELCYDWQRPKGCTNSARSHVHKCSGCGGKDHGAQECPQGENS